MTDGLAIALGEPGSGRRRYGAAMALYQAGAISDAALEVYRICSAMDRQDPGPLLAQGARVALAPGGDTLGRLLAEIDLYLAQKSGPGLAELRRALAQFEPKATRPGTPPKALAQALSVLAQSHPALAAAIGDAAPGLRWDCECAMLISADMQLKLQTIAPYGPPLELQGPALCLALTGPVGLRRLRARSATPKPAHRPIWVDAGRPMVLEIGPIPFLGLIATSPLPPKNGAQSP